MRTEGLRLLFSFRVGNTLLYEIKKLGGHTMYHFIAGLVVGFMLACMFSGDSLGGIDMTDRERSRVIGLVRRAAMEREATLILVKDGRIQLDMVTFPER